MRFVSPVALALTLAMAGTAPIAVAPAAAKEKAAQAPKLKLSPTFVPAGMKMQEALAKKDVEGAKAAAAVAEPLAVTNDDKYQFNALLLNLSSLANDGVMQGKAVVGMLDSGHVEPAMVGKFNIVAAQNALAAKDYDGTIRRAEAATAAGYAGGEPKVLAAQAWFGKAGTGRSNQEPARSAIVTGLKLFREGIEANKAAGTQVPAQWYQVGVGKAEAAGLPEVAEWARLAYTAAPSGENLRTVLRVFQRNTPTMTNRENLDLLRLMSASGALAIRPDFIEYAEMAFKAGVYGEVKTAIDAGRAKGALQPADGADFYTTAGQKVAADKASLTAAEADANKAANGKVASSTADAWLGYANYAKAIALYRLALQKGGVDTAEVNTRLGIALALSGDTAGAKTAFEQVGAAGTRGQIAKYWSLYLANKPA